MPGKKWQQYLVIIPCIGSFWLALNFKDLRSTSSYSFLTEGIPKWGGSLWGHVNRRGGAKPYQTPIVDAEISAFQRAFGPTSSNLMVSKPTITWEVWPSDGAKITSFTVDVDDKTISSTYDLQRKEVVATPDAAMAPGEHNVSCQAIVNGTLKISRTWKFSVAPEATAEPPKVLADEQTWINQINDLRRQNNLPEFSADGALCAAAWNHTTYMHKVFGVGHGGDGNPQQRLGQYGYDGGSYEDVGYFPNKSDLPIQFFFDAPYHRIPFIQPGLARVGASADEGFMTLEFTMNLQPGISTSPFNNQTGVPEEWTGIESPNPLAVHKATGPVGYPILISSFGGKDYSVVRADFQMTSAIGEPIAIWVNTPANDPHLDSDVILIPTKPTPAGTYRITGNVFTAKGDSVPINFSYSVK